MQGGLFSILGIAGLKSYLESIGRYAGTQLILTMALLVMIVMALGFGVTALTIWLASLWGAAVAFAVVGGGFLIAALILEVVIMMHKNRRARIASSLAGDMSTDQGTFGTVAAMAILGYILGRQIKRR